MEVLEINITPTIGSLRWEKVRRCMIMHLKYYLNQSDSINLLDNNNNLVEDAIYLLKMFTSLCLKETICLENDSQYFNICNEFRKEDYDDFNSNYFLVLLETSEHQFFLEIYEFILLYQTSQKDDMIMYADKKLVLRDTLGLLDVMMKDLYKNPTFHHKQSKTILNDHLNILSIAKERFSGSHQKYNSFIETLKKSKANDIISLYTVPYEKFNGACIYPIIFDLIYNRFALMLLISRYREKLISTKDYSNTVQCLLSEQVPPYDNRFSHLNGLHFLLNEIPIEFNLENKLRDDTNWMNNLKDLVTKIILLHYSEVFEIQYKKINSLFKQLEQTTTTYNESLYTLNKIESNVKLNFEDNFFRKLSLYIM